MELLLQIERGLESSTFLGEYVQQDGTVFFFEEAECLDEQWKIVAINRTEVLEAKLLKED